MKYTIAIDFDGVLNKYTGWKDGEMFEDVVKSTLKGFEHLGQYVELTYQKDEIHINSAPEEQFNQGAYLSKKDAMRLFASLAFHFGFRTDDMPFGYRMPEHDGLGLFMRDATV